MTIEIDLRGRTAIVIGASCGIGRGIAIAMASLMLTASAAAQLNPGKVAHPALEAVHAEDSLATATPAYDPARNATADVDAALAAARASGKHVLLIMGGDWCHDSMALFDLFHQQRFALMLAERYEIVWVDVGHRDRNIDIARRFGLAGIVGTPTVLILRPDGAATNLTDAPRWRNAASRKPEAIYRHFSRAVIVPRT